MSIPIEFYQETLDEFNSNLLLKYFIFEEAEMGDLNIFEDLEEANMFLEYICLNECIDKNKVLHMAKEYNEKTYLVMFFDTVNKQFIY